MTMDAKSEPTASPLSIALQIALTPELEEMIGRSIARAIGAMPADAQQRLAENVKQIERAVAELGATMGRHLWNLHAAIERVGAAMAEARGGAPANQDTGPGAAEPVAEPPLAGIATPEDAYQASAPSFPPMPADPRLSRSSVWTEERDVWLLARRSAGLGFREIWHELNRLPGIAIASPDAVKTRHSSLERQRRQQAVVPPAPEPEPTDWLTEARAKILDTGWPAGVQTFELRQRMAAEPGPPLPHNGTIAVRATSRKLRRPDGFQPLKGPAATAAAQALIAPPAPALLTAPPKRDSAPPAAPLRGGKVEIVRNTARPAVVLTGSSGHVAAPKPPAGVRAIPAELATRDGALSIACLQEHQDADAHAGEPITLEDAVAWAQNAKIYAATNKIELTTPDAAATVFQRINALRADLCLPPFRRIASRGTKEPLPDFRTGDHHEGAAA